MWNRSGIERESVCDEYELIASDHKEAYGNTAASIKCGCTVLENPSFKVENAGELGDREYFCR